MRIGLINRLPHQMFEARNQFGDEPNVIIAENLLVIDFYKPVVSVLVSRLEVERDRIVIQIRSFPKLEVSGWQ